MNDHDLRTAVDALKTLTASFEACFSDGSPHGEAHRVLEDAPRTMADLPVFFSTLHPDQARAAFVPCIVSAAEEHPYTLAHLTRALLAARSAMFGTGPVPRPAAGTGSSQPTRASPITKKRGPQRTGPRLSGRNRDIFYAMIADAPTRGSVVFPSQTAHRLGFPRSYAVNAAIAAINTGHFREGPRQRYGEHGKPSVTLIRVTDGPADVGGPGQSAASGWAGGAA
jgi:hypothetical protein